MSCVDGSRSRHQCHSVVSIEDHKQKEPSVMKISTVGLDLAKNVFQIHGIDVGGAVVVRRAVRCAAAR